MKKEMKNPHMLIHDIKLYLFNRKSLEFVMETLVCRLFVTRRSGGWVID